MAVKNGISNCDISLIKLNDVSEDIIDKDDDDEIEDPFCNANNPLKITFQDVTSAAFMIKSGVELTPCPVNLFLILFN